MTDYKGGLEFCVLYKEAEKLRIELSSSSEGQQIGKWIVGDVPQQFIVSAKKATFASTPLHLFTLDEEDLKYLYDKYSKAKEEVLKHSMEEYKNRYKDV